MALFWYWIIKEYKTMAAWMVWAVFIMGDLIGWGVVAQSGEHPASALYCPKVWGLFKRYFRQGSGARAEICRICRLNRFVWHFYFKVEYSTISHTKCVVERSVWLQSALPLFYAYSFMIHKKPPAGNTYKPTGGKRKDLLCNHFNEGKRGCRVL